jgi:hypothetical protein
MVDLLLGALNEGSVFSYSSLDQSDACQLFLIFKCRLFNSVGKEIKKITIDFLLNF